MTRPQTAQRAYEVLMSAGVHPSEAQRVLAALSGAGIQLADELADELVTRWVNVLERPVPPDADTIIRTNTTTVGQQTSSLTHWLDGLRNPRAVPRLR